MTGVNTVQVVSLNKDVDLHSKETHIIISSQHFSKTAFPSQAVAHLLEHQMRRAAERGWGS